MKNLATTIAIAIATQQALVEIKCDQNGALNLFKNYENGDDVSF